MKQFMVVADTCSLSTQNYNLSFATFSGKVSGYLASGWQLHEDLKVTHVKNTIVLIQAMVR